MHSVSAVLGPTVKGSNAGIWWGDRDKVVVLVGCLDRIHEAGEGVRGENSKPSAMHSVSVVPDPMVRGGDAGIWWGGRIKAVVVVGHPDRKREAEKRVGG
jgi:hypothetical protein